MSVLQMHEVCFSTYADLQDRTEKSPPLGIMMNSEAAAGRHGEQDLWRVGGAMGGWKGRERVGEGGGVGWWGMHCKERPEKAICTCLHPGHNQQQSMGCWSTRGPPTWKEAGPIWSWAGHSTRQGRTCSPSACRTLVSQTVSGIWSTHTRAVRCNGML